MRLVRVEMCSQCKIYADFKREYKKNVRYLSEFMLLKLSYRGYIVLNNLLRPISPIYFVKEWPLEIGITHGAHIILLLDSTGLRWNSSSLATRGERAGSRLLSMDHQSSPPPPNRSKMPTERTFLCLHVMEQCFPLSGNSSEAPPCRPGGERKDSILCSLVNICKVL